MKTDNAMQLKAKINSKAKELNVPPQIMFQNYMMECFLERLSKSEYADRFIIKGGVLISSIVGLNNRTTMDIDTTVRNIPLNEREITKIISYVCSVENDDDFFFSLDRVEPIREDDEYEGYRTFVYDVRSQIPGVSTYPKSFIAKICHIIISGRRKTSYSPS